MHRLSSLLSLALLAMPAALFAGAGDSAAVRLPEVVISATRTEKLLSETGRSVSVITHDDIVASGYPSVTSLLSSLEGLYIVGGGQVPGANQSIFLRGTNSNQAAILVDGVRINDPSTVNNTIDLAELSPDDIDRIEVIRGAQSTLYGSSAMGGVIQIFTRKPQGPGASGRVTGAASWIGPSDFAGTGSLTLRYAGARGNWISATASKDVSGGIDATIDTSSDPSALPPRDKDGWDRLSAGFSAGRLWKSFQVSAGFRYLDMHTDLDKAAYRDDDNYTLHFIRNIVQSQGVYSPDSSTSLTGSFSWSSTLRRAVDDSSLADLAGNYDHTYYSDRYSGDLWHAELLFRKKQKRIDWLSGYSFDRESMNQESYYYSPYYSAAGDLSAIRPAITGHSMFLQADASGALLFRNAERLHLVGGVRWYYQQRFGSQLTWEFNPSVRTGQSGLCYFSFTSGYNVPSLYQLYAPETYATWDNGSTTGLTRGNSGLEPETSDAWEAGYKWHPRRGSMLSLAAFRSVTRRSIEYAYLWDPAIPVDQLGTDFMRDDYRGDRYLNTGTMVAQGLEAAIAFPVSRRLTAGANATYVSGYTDFAAFDTSASGAAGGQTVQLYNSGVFLAGDAHVGGLTRRPSTVNAWLEWQVSAALTLRGACRWVGSRTDVYYESTLGPYGALSGRDIGAYSLFSAGATVKAGKRLTCVLVIDNVLNRSYEEIYGFSTLGRNGRLSVSWSW
jgi:vitamin B12 transporter